MRTLIVLAFLLNPLFSEAIEPYSCRNGRFPSQITDIRQAKVSTTENGRLHFRDDMKGCPDSAQCFQKAYLVAGDKLLVSESTDDWTCGWFFGKKREFVGWLPTRHLEISPVEPVHPLGDWAGIWSSSWDSGEITIELKDGELEVSGNAYWYGLGGNANEGSIGGKGTPVGDLLTLDDSYSCTVRMRLVSSYLIVTDNGHCGGMNVRFDGIYRRSP